MSFLPSYKEQPVIHVLVIALLTALVLFVGIRTWNGYTERAFIGKPDTVRDTISIAGEGKVSAKPTLARVQFGVVTQASTAAKAQADNTQKMNAVITALQQLGIEKKDLETSGYWLNPMYDYTKNPALIQGYTISQNLQVKVRDFDKLSNVLSRGVELGINQVNDVVFTIDDPKTLREEARLEALEDAKKKAENLAKALGVDLVRVVSFSESSVTDGGVTPMYYREAAVSMGAPAAAPSIQAGEQDVEVGVMVTYEIR